MSEPTMTPSVLIAGCGDIGTGLGLRLASQGISVTGLRRNAGALPQAIEPMCADLGDAQSLYELRARRFDLVVVAASADGFSAESYRRLYVDGLESLLGVLAGSPAVLLVSSTGVYHQIDGEWVNETSATQPVGFSGQALLQAEQLLAARAPAAYCVLRAGGIYGPGRDRLLEEVRRGIGVSAEPVRYTNRIHREDCIGALAFLADKLLTREPIAKLYLGVDSEPAPAHEVRQWIAKQLHVELVTADNGGPLGRGGNKRCSNALLKAAGYRFLYPDYRAGYGALLGLSTPP